MSVQGDRGDEWISELGAGVRQNSRVAPKLVSARSGRSSPHLQHAHNVGADLARGGGGERL